MAHQLAFRSRSRSAFVAALVPFALALVALVGGDASAQIRITEWMYAGSSSVGGEFVEFTNVGAVPIDMTGWSFDDDTREPGAFDLSGFGVVQPGESVIMTEDPAGSFRADWGLAASVKIVGNLGNPTGRNLGRNDEINLYDAEGILVDRLTYGDQAFPGSIRTRWFSGSPLNADALGANDPYAWMLAVDGDAYGSWTSANGDVGNPGLFALQTFNVIPVAINEVMASNATTLADEDGDFSDWIEILNHGDQPIDLAGFGLTDNLANPFKWTFPAITLPPGQFIIVFASGKDRPGPQLHANFAISAGGESLALTSPQGQPVDVFPATPMATDISIGRVPDGIGDWKHFAAPTPGSANLTQAYLGVVPPVTFSPPGGMHTTEFELTLACADPLAEIRYTLDGTIPTPSSSLYDGPLAIASRVGDPNVFALHQQSPDTGYFGPPEQEIFKITIVRARAFRPEYIPAPVTTTSHLVDPLGANRYSLPVVSIVTEPDSLFAYVGGIFVPGSIYDQFFNPDQIWWARPANYNRRGIEWEREGHIEFYEPDGTLGFASGVGLRIHGGITRAFHRKAFRLYFRNQYGLSTLEYPVFGPGHPNLHKRLLLRSSGNDWQRAMFRDAYHQRVVEGLGMDTQASRTVIAFVNGEYWGIHHIRERFDRHYVGFTHGVDPDDVDLLVNNMGVQEGNNQHYAQMMAFVNSHDLSDDANFAQLETMMDVDNFITYLNVQVFLRNYDWPHNNIRFWRERTEGARWRWMLFDTDQGTGMHGVATSYTNNAVRRLVEDLTGWSSVLINAVFQNEGFRHRFINRAADLMNSTFLPPRTLAILDEFEGMMVPEFAENIARWNAPTNTVWNQHRQIVRNFMLNRPSFNRLHYVSTFDLDGVAFISVDNANPGRGTVGISTLPLENALLPWVGTYFQSVPLPLHAHPEPGYRFLGWDGFPESVDQTTFHVLVTSVPLDLVARFAPIGDLDGDGVVDGADLGVLLSGWGACPTEGGCLADLNGDGVVDGADLGILLSNWSTAKR